MLPATVSVPPRYAERSAGRTRESCRRTIVSRRNPRARREPEGFRFKARRRETIPLTVVKRSICYAWAEVVGWDRFLSDGEMSVLDTRLSNVVA